MKTLNAPFQHNKLFAAISECLDLEGKTFQEISDAAGVARSTVYRILMQDKEPTFETLVKLSNYLELPIQYFFTETKKRA